LKEESSEGGGGHKALREGDFGFFTFKVMSTLMNDKLVAPITKDELMWVAKNLAPCPDGFVIKFCIMFMFIGK
jgi:hypothetical protein